MTAPVNLVVGCGYLGLRVARLWRGAGARVLALTRSPDRAAARQGGCGCTGHSEAGGRSSGLRGLRSGVPVGAAPGGEGAQAIRGPKRTRSRRRGGAGGGACAFPYLLDGT